MTTNSQFEQTDLVCLSHLRWDFVFQRPQHLMSRFARKRRVFFVEEPVLDATTRPHCEGRICPSTGVHVIVPRLQKWEQGAVAGLLGQYLRDQGVKNPILWFYSPMWVEEVPTGLTPVSIVYDCMDELSGFKGASERLQDNEARLMRIADVVFTGGVSLFEAKCSLHPHVHPFPSGVDVAHFAQARGARQEPADSQALPRPRLGFAGVIDERIDYELLRETALLRPDWQFVMIGPVVKVDPAMLPHAPNLHWLGMRQYRDLPSYFAHWDVAMMPFALNEATRYISPTKTPEFLAAGLPVVSTPIRDVVRPYGDLGLARIASTAPEFVSAAEEAMSYSMGLKWRERADAFLQSMSWDSVWASMNAVLANILGRPPQNSSGPGSREHKEQTAYV
jgi:UDP-galactopyranose mutase